MIDSNTAKLLKKRLAAALGAHGATSDFCRKTGLARNTVENWLKGFSSPNVDSLDKIAEVLGVQSWELLKPQGAQETKKAPDLTEVVELLTRIAPQLERLDKMSRVRSQKVIEAIDVMLDKALSIESGAGDPNKKAN